MQNSFAELHQLTTFETNQTKDFQDTALLVFIALRNCIYDVICENRAKNLRNGDVHLAQIPDFGI